MYIYHASIDAQGPHMIHININTVCYTRVEHSPTNTIYIKYYMLQKSKCNESKPFIHTCVCQKKSVVYERSVDMQQFREVSSKLVSKHGA